MAYNQNIPQPTDTLSQSQQDILANFRALNTLFTNGIQNTVIFPVFPSGDPTTAAGQVALYSKVGITGTQDLFRRAPSNGAIVDMTASNQANPGWSYLPSGILIKWGTITLNQRNDLESFSFPASGSIPAFNSIFSMTVSQTFPGSPSLSQINTAVAVGNFSVTGFQVFARAIGTPGSTPALNVTYFAIGN